MGLPTVLFLIFLVLKLCAVIDWSWWLIFLPLIFEFIMVSVTLYWWDGQKRRMSHFRTHNRSLFK